MLIWVGMWVVLDQPQGMGVGPAVVYEASLEDKRLGSLVRGDGYLDGPFLSCSKGRNGNFLGLDCPTRFAG